MTDCRWVQSIVKTTNYFLAFIAKELEFKNSRPCSSCTGCRWGSCLYTVHNFGPLNKEDMVPLEVVQRWITGLISGMRGCPVMIAKPTLSWILKLEVIWLRTLWRGDMKSEGVLTENMVSPGSNDKDWILNIDGISTRCSNNLLENT